MEIFKELKGYDGYQISNCGRVKTMSKKLRYTHAVTGVEHFRVTTERFLKVYKNERTGYKFVQIRSNGVPKNRTIHRLVAIAFIHNPSNYDCVNHIDGNKHNNTVENLEWCTNEYNHKHATKSGLKPSGSRVGSSKLTEGSVHAIKWLLKEGYSHTKLGKMFKVSRSAISLISLGVTWDKVTLTGTELTIKE